MNPAHAILMVVALQLVCSAGTLVAVRTQYRRRSAAAVAARAPPLPPRPLLYLGLWLVWLLSAIALVGAVYFVSLA